MNSLSPQTIALASAFLVIALATVALIAFQETEHRKVAHMESRCTANVLSSMAVIAGIVSMVAAYLLITGTP